MQVLSYVPSSSTCYRLPWTNSTHYPREVRGGEKKKDTSIKLFTPHQLFQGGFFFFFTSRLENELSNRKKARRSCCHPVGPQHAEETGWQQEVVMPADRRRWSSDQVQDQLRNVKVHKSMGCDEMHSWILMELFPDPPGKYVKAHGK